MSALKDVMRSPRAQAAVRLALDEDLGNVERPVEGWCDCTSEALVDDRIVATGEIYAKGTGCVVSGATVARAVMKAVDPKIKVEILKGDGSVVKPLEPILTFRGKARSILAAERTALNFMQRMCATATLTRRFVDAVKAYGTIILDTRKTTPGLRVFEKYAVRCGGGANHRMGMYDRVLMKDNHRKIWNDRELALDEAVVAARKRFPRLAVEVEVETLEQCASALKASPEWIMLDNMSVADMKRCVKLCRGTATKTEASGGITLARAKQVAATGVTAISLGCLTHSAGSVDLSLEWQVGQ